MGAHNVENANKLEMQSPIESQRYQSHLQLQLSQISEPVPEPHNNISKFQHVFSERDLELVSTAFFVFYTARSSVCRVSGEGDINVHNINANAHNINNATVGMIKKENLII